MFSQPRPLGAQVQKEGVFFRLWAPETGSIDLVIEPNGERLPLEMFPGRFWLAVGSGEALNARITGEPWPEKSIRNARLQESVEVMRALWRGETVTRDGLVRANES